MQKKKQNMKYNFLHFLTFAKKNFNKAAGSYTIQNLFFNIRQCFGT